MKLAEALQERADLNKKIEQLGARLQNNALVQDGETTAEDPEELLAEFESAVARLEELMSKINLKNCQTVADGKTLTELIAKRDCLKIKYDGYIRLINAASQKVNRYSNTEIKILSAVDVKKLQKEADATAQKLRLVDNKIQETNWLTEL